VESTVEPYCSDIKWVGRKQEAIGIGAPNDPLVGCDLGRAPNSIPIAHQLKEDLDNVILVAGKKWEAWIGMN
jgi:hypothetical protein